MVKANEMKLHYARLRMEQIYALRMLYSFALMLKFCVMRKVLTMHGHLYICS